MATTHSFPAVLAAIQDSQYFQIELEDKGIKGEADGGYVHVRPRHTRKPRRTFKTGFTELTQDQYQILLDFYDLVGTYTKFAYVNPTTLVVHEVRFNKAFSGKYKGMGGRHLWNVTDIELIEV